MNLRRRATLLTSLLLALLAQGGGVGAQTAIPVGIGAAIPDAVEIVISPLGGPFTTELASLDTSDVTIADLEISSNGPSGFQITLTSLNQGKLVREGGSPSRESDFATYLLDLEDRPGGSLGTTLPSPQERRDLDLTLGTEIVRFDDNVSGPTVQKIFALEIHTRAKAGLFAGTYTDTVTVTVEDL